MTTENKVIGGIIVLTMAIIVGIVMAGGQSAPPPIESAKVDTGEAIRSTSHKLGSDDAKVKIVEFADFQCPACGQAHPILKQVLQDKGDKIQFVVRHYPLSTIHHNADNAARAAEAADLQGEFWAMHDQLFATQGEWENSLKAKDIFVTYAKNLGLNEEQFKSDFDSQTVVDRIKQDKGDGNALGVDSTPTFYINGEKYTDAVSTAAIGARIDDLLK